MGYDGPAGYRFRQRIRDEREQRGWSQADVAKALNERGMIGHSSTIAKIEAGDRAVRIDELCGFADVFGVSVDRLLGVPGSERSSDLAWAVSKLTSNAQKMAGEVSALRLRLIDEAADVHHYADDFHAVDIKEATYAAAAALEDGRRALAHLANQFPLPTNFGPAPKGEEGAGPKGRG